MNSITVSCLIWTIVVEKQFHKFLQSNLQCSHVWKPLLLSDFKVSSNFPTLSFGHFFETRPRKNQWILSIMDNCLKRFKDSSPLHFFQSLNFFAEICRWQTVWQKLSSPPAWKIRFMKLQSLWTDRFLSRLQHNKAFLQQVLELRKWRRFASLSL